MKTIEKLGCHTVESVISFDMLRQTKSNQCVFCLYVFIIVSLWFDMIHTKNSKQSKNGFVKSVIYSHFQPPTFFGVLVSFFFAKLAQSHRSS